MVSMSGMQSPDGVEAMRGSHERRAAALLEMRRRSEADAHDPIPWIIRRAADDPALLRLRVWRIDQAAFGTGRTVAIRRVARAAEWCDAPLARPQAATLSWLLDARTGGARLSAWLLAVGLDMGFRLHGPDPFTRG